MLQTRSANRNQKDKQSLPHERFLEAFPLDSPDANAGRKNSFLVSIGGGLITVRRLIVKGQEAVIVACGLFLQQATSSRRVRMTRQDDPHSRTACWTVTHTHLSRLAQGPRADATQHHRGPPARHNPLAMVSHPRF